LRGERFDLCRQSTIVQSMLERLDQPRARGVGVIVLLLIVAFLVWRRKKRANELRAAGAKEIDLMATTSKFHAVSIRPGPDACRAALGLAGQRFLSDAAPSIPLPSCEAENCRCRFVHFSDRRDGDDRRSPFPAAIGIDTGTWRTEQRQSGDRRKNSSR
jgi:hypothetical protein